MLFIDGLRLLSWIMSILTTSGPWLGLYVALNIVKVLLSWILLTLVFGTWSGGWMSFIFSAQGSMLLWVTLTAIILLRWQWPTRINAAGDRKKPSIRSILGALGLMKLLELTSAAPQAPIAATGLWLVLAVIHPIAIFISYSFQTLLLCSSLQPTDPIIKAAQFRWFKWAWASMVVGVTTGAGWAKLAWGHWWSWEPIELLGLASVIWLSGIWFYRLRLAPRWTSTAALLIPLYTVAATGLIRSGLLAGGRHGYLSEKHNGLLALALVGIALTCKVVAQLQGSKSAPIPQLFYRIMGVGTIHWLAGLALVLWPPGRFWWISVILITWLLLAIDLVGILSIYWRATKSSHRKLKDGKML